MFDLVKRLMIARELEFGEGRIAFFNQRMQLLDPAFFAYRLNYADNFWKEAYLQYKSMRDANISGWFKPVKTEKELKGDELIKWAVKYFNLGGWGKFVFLSSRIPEGNVLVRIENSPTGVVYKELFGHSKYPVCHVTRGGLAGGGSAVLDRDIAVVEKQCIAQGHSCCIMLFKPEEEFVETKNNEYRMQLNLPVQKDDVK